MARLRTADYEALLAFVGRASGVDGPEPFTTELMDELAMLFRAEFVTFEELDLVDRRVISYVPCSNEVAACGERAGELGQDDWEGLERSTTLAALREGDAVRTWSELFSRPDRLSHRACEELSREWGVFDQLLVWLDRRPRRKAVVSAHRERDFGDREREMAKRLHPHLVALRRGAIARRQLAAVHAALEWQSDTELVVLEERDVPVPLTAREWDVMRCIAAGKTNAETGRILWISPATVRKHLEHVYAKLGVRSRTAALARLRPSLAGGARLDAA